MSKTPEQLRANFKARHGHMPGEAKPTAEQQRIVREAIEARDQAASTATAPAYSGADFQLLIENYRDKRKCSYSDAYVHVLRTEQGQAAHRAFLKKKNPHVSFEE